MKESIALWQHYADIKEQFSDRILQGKAQLYAARYHAQEQQREIEQQRAEAHRNSIIAWAVGAIALLAIAFALWLFRQKRIVNDKNRVLVRQIKENLLLTLMQRSLKRKWSFSGLATMTRILLMCYVDYRMFFENPERDWQQIQAYTPESPPELELKFE